MQAFPIKNLVDLFRYRAQQSPNQTAYTYLKEGIVEDSRLSYAELDVKAKAGAVVIRRYVPVNGRVLLLYPPGIDFMVGFAACLYAGVIAIPAPPPDTVRLKRTLPRLKAIAQDAQASLVLSSGELLASIQKSTHAAQAAMDTFAVPNWLDYAALNEASADDWHMPNISGDTLAYLQYTSGSTASPKGVMMSHANLMHHLAQIQQAWGYDEHSVSVTWMPYFHDYGLVDGLLEPLFTGIPCYVLSPLTFLKRPLRWLQAISNYRGTHTQAPNFAYSYCLEKISDEQLKQLDLSCLKVAGNGAEPVRWETVDAFNQRFAACGFRAECCYPAYGLAEATLLVATKPHGVLPSRYRLSAEQRQDDSIQGLIVSCGSPIGVTEVKIVNPDTLALCDDGAIGEIWIKDLAVAQGYWQNQQATQDTFQAHTRNGEGSYLRSGDLGFLRDGELFITGRLKDLIIINGVNHYPQDIEWTVIQAHAALRPEHAAAFSVQVDNQERPVIVAELNQQGGDYPAIVQAIRTALAEVHELDAYAVALLKKGSILKTSSGKLQRHACRQAFLHGRLDSHELWQQPSLVQADSATANVADWLIAKLAQALAIAPDGIDVDQVFASYGLSSRLAVSLVGELEDFLAANGSKAVELSPVLLWQYPTVATLAAFVQTQLHSAGIVLGATQEPHSLEQSPIAVIGMGCRFPDADSPDEFWRLLVDGHDAIKDIPAERWDVASYPQINSRRAGLLADVDLFDAEFFGIADKEADAMDPQQRLVLEVAYQALEYAGIAPDSLAGSETGVFIGISTDDYAAWQLSDMEAIDTYASTGKTFSIAANRLSYLLDLRGPSLALDTACSSSLVAVHQACQSLRQQECSLALAGGVNLLLSPQLMVALSAANMLSPDSRCKTFAADADGYVRGEGCGVVVLKRLADAERDGDSVLAVIRGSALNQDGRSNGLTAPNLNAQQSVINKALANAQIKAEAISYIEAHGTGTPLGDPIEMDALLSVFRYAPKLNVGSVKTNIGHLEAAAGIAGLIKVIQSLRHQTIPAHLHCETRNPLIKLDGTGFNIPSTTQPWRVEPRIAGISSFGFGGTNAHIIVSEAGSGLNRAVGVQALACTGANQGLHSNLSTVMTGLTHHPEAKQSERSTENQTAQLLPLSAKSPLALQQLLQRYVDFIAREPQVNLADLGYNAAIGRSAFNYRTAVVAETAAGLVEALQAEIPKTLTAVSKTPRKIAFLCTGQGAQTRQMGLQLYQTEPVFKAAIDICADLLTDELPLPLTEVLFNDDDSLLNQTGYIQALLFSLQYALAKLWESWGIKPDVLLGHSVGEYAVACLAGIFELPDALKLIAARGRLMQALPATGGMAAVFAEAEVVEAALAKVSGQVLIAGYNSRRLQVISGENDAIAAVCALLREQGISSQALTVSHAFHSPLMRDMLAAFAEVAHRCRYHLPHTAIVSSLTGQRIDQEMSAPDYWLAHIIEPVRFASAVTALLAENCQFAIEIGPQPHASTMAQQAIGAESVQWLPSLKRGADDREVLLNAAAKLYQQGVTFDWRAVYGSQTRQRLPGLPNYPFQRQRYWLDTQPVFAREPLMKPTPLYYQWHWLPKPLQSAKALVPQTWLIFADRSGVAEGLAQQLSAMGHRCRLVFSGDDNRVLTAEQSWQIQPSLAGLQYLQTQVQTTQIVHLWSLDLDAGVQADSVLQQQNLACFSILHILQQWPVQRLWLVTRQAYALATGDSIQPNQAPLSGMAKAIALEYPTVFRGIIDIGSEAEWMPLIAELSAKNTELAVALRGRQRYVGRLQPYPLTTLPSAATLIKAHGTYLISGGLGALGLQLAKRLVKLGAKDLVLLARRPATKQQQAAIDELGCRVQCLQADVASRLDMQVVAAKLKQLPPLLGIIHAAGVAGDKALSQLTEEDFSQTLRAKVQGACLLHELSLDFPLDFFCLLSSIASVWGAKERAHYAAANQFLDALSAYRRQHKLPALSLNFGPWQGSGMAADLSDELAQSGIRALNPEQILAALPQILSDSAAQIIVVDADWPRLSALFAAYAGAGLFGPLLKPADKAGALIAADAFPDQLRHAPKDKQQILLCERLQTELSQTLGLKKHKAVDSERGFFEMGMDSLMAVQFRARLEHLFGLSLPTTLAFDYPTIQQLAAFLLVELFSEPDQLASLVPKLCLGMQDVKLCLPGNIKQSLKVVTPKLELGSETKNARRTIEQLQQSDQEAIAIIGIGCRFPGGVDSPESYWQLLAEGQDAVVEVPAKRWNSRHYYHPEPSTAGFTNTTRAAFIDQIDQFDPQFFNISPREAINLDPQQRLVLETAWEALERAGHMPERLAGTSAGVFIGITANDYAQLSDDRVRYDAYFNSGNSLNVAAGRLSYTLGFTGPSMAVDTACSSSLTAVHLACQSLKQRECGLALAGGVNLMLLAQNFVALSQAGMLSGDGHCKTFDAAANGYVRGEGCGIVVLKRLSDALADRDNILAVIRGSAVNQDGASGGLTVPSGLAQQAVIEQALSNAKVSPEMIAYIEAHGTGTPLGDPIEVNALAAVFGASHSAEQPLYIGSVKTNIGHLESAAGIAGLIKLVLALQHQKIPKQLHFQTPNPHIDWAGLPIKVLDRPIAWPRSDKRRLAGVSAFGFSGSNAHIILEEAPLPMASEAISAANALYLLPLSAKTEAALKALQQRYLDYFSAQPELDFAAVCYTAALGRQHFSQRSVVIAADLEQAKQHLQAQLSAWEGLLMWERRPRRDLSDYRDVGVAPTTLAATRDDSANKPLNSIKNRYLQGEKIDWASVYGTRKQPKIVLPTYPFQRQRYWLDTNNSTSQNQNSGHPLLGAKIPSALRTVQYQTLLSPEQPQWLADHRLPPHIVFPATGYLELALAAGRQLLHSEQLSIQGLNISQALIVDGRLSVQTLLEPTDSGYHFTIASSPEAQQHQGSWTTHAEGQLSLSHASEPAHPVAAASIDTSIDISAYYQSYRDQGLAYGHSFQNIRSLSVKHNCVTGLIALSAHDQHDAPHYLLHPALFDSCLQLLKAALPAHKSQRYLPVALEQLSLYRSGADAAYCQATLTAADRSDDYHAELKIYDTHGQPLAELKRLTLRPVSAEQLMSQSQSYRIIWQAQPLNAHSSTQSQLLFIEPGKLAEQLSIQLPNSHLVSSGSTYQQLDARHSQIDPLQPEHYRRLLADHPNTVSIIHAWSESRNGFETAPETSADTPLVAMWASLPHQSPDETSADPDRLIAQAQQHSCGSVLLLVQALTASPAAPARTLTLITRGAQAVYRNTGDSETALQTRLNPLQAPLLGLAKVIVLEHPELQCRRIDLDPDANIDVAAEAEHIAQELQQPKPAQKPIAEDQIAYRQGQRYVPRLQKYSLTKTKQQRRLQLSRYGIEQLQLNATETALPAPTAGHLQISVSASGLNFKDVLHALGMLKFSGSALDAIPFGFECAGTVSQIGAGVEGFNIGDRVMAVLTPGSMADRVNVDVRYVILTPNNLSDLEAAALPLAYLTAGYGLEQLAQLKAGDSILIHAAAGGVGQAAIQIAQQHGLAIYASAHPDKWPLLQAQGIQHLYHSRQADYAQAINQATGGHGVDIILNSLSGDFINENLRCLAQNGRVIEIGKLGILTPEQMQQQRPDVHYHIFDLGEIGRQQPQLIQSLFKHLGEQLQQQSLLPLPLQIYPLERASDAFQCMAQARHQGKIVLNHSAHKIKAQHSYLITGGLGGLGLKLAGWLIQQGATHLILNSRNPANEAAQAHIKSLQQQAGVELIVADISQAQQVQRLFEQIKQNQPPLAGIIHAAGKLDDGMLQQLNWQRFTRVFKAKINGSWHLHHYSQHLPLDFFIEFSSAAALLGAPGQGNYAAANAFQDALAHYRKLKNLPALSINWGPWGEVGMLKGLQAQDQQRLLKSGWQQIKPQQGLATLEALMTAAVTQVGVLDVNWPQYWQQSFSAITPAFLSDLKAATALPVSPTKSFGFIERLADLSLMERKAALQRYLHDKVASVLGLTTTIEPRRRLFDLGLDSLMSVELKNRLESELKQPLSSTLVFDYPTLEDLQAYLMSDILPEWFAEETAPVEQTFAGDIAELLAKELAELSAGKE